MITPGNNSYIRITPAALACSFHRCSCLLRTKSANPSVVEIQAKILTILPWETRRRFSDLPHCYTCVHSCFPLHEGLLVGSLDEILGPPARIGQVNESGDVGAVSEPLLTLNPHDEQSECNGFALRPLPLHPKNIATPRTKPKLYQPPLL
jgi:hypothetical protein